MSDFWILIIVIAYQLVAVAWMAVCETGESPSDWPIYFLYGMFWPFTMVYRLFAREQRP